MITKIKEMIRHMGLKEDETIISVKELEQLKFEAHCKKIRTNHPKKAHKRKRNSSEILWSDSHNKGQIKKRNDGTVLYYYYDKKTKKPYYRVGEYQDLVVWGLKFEETGYNLNKWNLVKQEVFPHTKKTREINVNKDANNRWYIKKMVNNKSYYFGKYSDKRMAEEVKQFLIYKNWDLQYEPKQLLPAHRKKFETDEYYLTMKPIMDMDTEYQQYKKEKGVFL